MKDPVVARIEELEWRDRDKDAVFTPEELDEYDRLKAQREIDMFEARPRLMCCEASRMYPALTFYVPLYGESEVEGEDADSRKTPGEWHVTLDKNLSEKIQQFQEKNRPRGKPSTYYQNAPEPKYCPYCGTHVPEMRRKDPAPQNILVVSDGGYYCDTCEERLNICQCLPAEFAWEPVPK